MGETILLSVISMLIAIAATFFIVPLLNQFTGKSIEFNPFTNPILGLIILAAGVVIGMLAGIYPALGVIRISANKSFKEYETYW